MTNESEHEDPTYDSPYNNPDLIERAGGDKMLLDRLVGLDITRQLLEENPADLGIFAAYQTMLEVVEKYEQGKK
jgi:hypothetical protein